MSEPESAIELDVIPVIPDIPISQVVEAITKITYRFATFIVWVIISFTAIAITSYIIIDAYKNGDGPNWATTWAALIFGTVIGIWMPPPSASKTKKRTFTTPTV